MFVLFPLPHTCFRKRRDPTVLLYSSAFLASPGSSNLLVTQLKVALALSDDFSLTLTACKYGALIFVRSVVLEVFVFSFAHCKLNQQEYLLHSEALLKRKWKCTYTAGIYEWQRKQQKWNENNEQEISGSENLLHHCHTPSGGFLLLQILLRFLRYSNFHVTFSFTCAWISPKDLSPPHLLSPQSPKISSLVYLFFNLLFWKGFLIKKTFSLCRAQQHIQIIITP